MKGYVTRFCRRSLCFRYAVPSILPVGAVHAPAQANGPGRSSDQDGCHRPRPLDYDQTVRSCYTVPCTVPCTVSYTVLPIYTLLHHALPYHTMPCHTTPYHTIPYHIKRYIPYHAIPRHTMPRHTIPYHTTTPYHAMYQIPGRKTVPGTQYHTIQYNIIVQGLPIGAGIRGHPCFG